MAQSAWLALVGVLAQCTSQAGQRCIGFAMV